MPFIELTRGLRTLVDDEDYAELSKHKWFVTVSTSHDRRFCYATRHDPVITDPITGKRKQPLIRMHRIIAGAVAGELVDHINHDTLDNRRVNLRRCTRSENMRNRRINRNKRSSQYKGVFYEEGARGGVWRAKIRVDGHLKSIGKFPDEERAARAYDAEALKQYGEFALVNFPKAS